MCPKNRLLTISIRSFNSIFTVDRLLIMELLSCGELSLDDVSTWTVKWKATHFDFKVNDSQV